MHLVILRVVKDSFACALLKLGQYFFKMWVMLQDEVPDLDDELSLASFGKSNTVNQLSQSSPALKGVVAACS